MMLLLISLVLCLISATLWEELMILKDRVTGEISFDWEPAEGVEQHLCLELDIFFVREFPASKIVFCPLVGVELNRIGNI